MFARAKVNFPSLEGVKLVCWLCSYAAIVGRARFKSDHMQMLIKLAASF